MGRGIGLAAGAILALAGGAAFADDRGDIIASCAANLGLPPAGCECIADKATSDFNPREFAFFIAVIKGDQAAQATAMQELTPEEAVGIGERMNAMPAECTG